MIPEEVAIIQEILEEGYEMDPKLAARAAWDIYNEFQDKFCKCN